MSDISRELKRHDDLIKYLLSRVMRLEQGSNSITNINNGSDGEDFREMIRRMRALTILNEKFRAGVKEMYNETVLYYTIISNQSIYGSNGYLIYGKNFEKNENDELFNQDYYQKGLTSTHYATITIPYIYGSDVDSLEIHIQNAGIDLMLVFSSKVRKKKEKYMAAEVTVGYDIKLEIIKNAGNVSNQQIFSYEKSYDVNPMYKQNGIDPIYDMVSITLIEGKKGKIIIHNHDNDSRLDLISRIETNGDEFYKYVSEKYIEEREVDLKNLALKQILDDKKDYGTVPLIWSLDYGFTMPNEKIVVHTLDGFKYMMNMMYGTMLDMLGTIKDQDEKFIEEQEELATNRLGSDLQVALMQMFNKVQNLENNAIQAASQEFSLDGDIDGGIGDDMELNYNVMDRWSSHKDIDNITWNHESDDNTIGKLKPDFLIWHTKYNVTIQQAGNVQNFSLKSDDETVIEGQISVSLQNIVNLGQIPSTTFGNDFNGGTEAVKYIANVTVEGNDGEMFNGSVTHDAMRVVYIEPGVIPKIMDKTSMHIQNGFMGNIREIKESIDQQMVMTITMRMTGGLPLTNEITSIGGFYARLGDDDPANDIPIVVDYQGEKVIENGEEYLEAKGVVDLMSIYTSNNPIYILEFMPSTGDTLRSTLIYSSNDRNTTDNVERGMKYTTAHGEAIGCTTYINQGIDQKHYVDTGIIAGYQNAYSKDFLDDKHYAKIRSAIFETKDQHGKPGKSANKLINQLIWRGHIEDNSWVIFQTEMEGPKIYFGDRPVRIIGKSGEPVLSARMYMDVIGNGTVETFDKDKQNMMMILYGLMDEVKNLEEDVFTLKEQVKMIMEAIEKQHESMMMQNILSWPTLGGTQFGMILGIVTAIVTESIVLADAFKDGFSFDTLVMSVELMIQVAMAFKMAKKIYQGPPQDAENPVPRAASLSEQDYNTFRSSDTISFTSMSSMESESFSLTDRVGSKFGTLVTKKTKGVRGITEESSFFTKAKHEGARANQRKMLRRCEQMNVLPSSDEMFLRYSKGENESEIYHCISGSHPIKDLPQTTKPWRQITTHEPTVIKFKYELKEGKWTPVSFEKSEISKASLCKYLKVDPSVERTDAEYAELYNTASKAVNTRLKTVKNSADQFSSTNVVIYKENLDALDEFFVNIGKNGAANYANLGTRTYGDMMRDLLLTNRNSNGWIDPHTYTNYLNSAFEGYAAENARHVNLTGPIHEIKRITGDDCKKYIDLIRIRNRRLIRRHQNYIGRYRNNKWRIRKKWKVVQ